MSKTIDKNQYYAAIKWVNSPYAIKYFDAGAGFLVAILLLILVYVILVKQYIYIICVSIVALAFAWGFKQRWG